MFFPVNGDPYRNNVVMHLPMTGENNSTTFTDVSQSPKTVTSYGDAKISTNQSKWGGGSGYFDGSGDYLSFPYTGFNFLTNTTESFTVEAWVYLTNYSTYRCIMQHGDNGPNNPSLTILVLPTGYLSSSISRTDINGAITSTSLAVISTGQWVHFACCYNYSTSTLNTFLNGVKGNDAVKTGTYSYPTSNPKIGAYINVNNFPWLGYIQDLRITQDVARYTANFTIPDNQFSIRSQEMPIQKPLMESSFNIARLGL